MSGRMNGVGVGRSVSDTARIVLGVSLALVGWSSLVRAEQFVLFDETFTFTHEDAVNSQPSQSHHYVGEDRLNP